MPFTTGDREVLLMNLLVSSSYSTTLKEAVFFPYPCLMWVEVRLIFSFPLSKIASYSKYIYYKNFEKTGESEKQI